MVWLYLVYAVYAVLVFIRIAALGWFGMWTATALFDGGSLDMPIYFGVLSLLAGMEADRIERILHERGQS